MSDHGYDLLSSSVIETPELRAFLLDCFGITEPELFVSPTDRVDEGLRDVPDDVVFAAFCTFEPVLGDFATTLTVGVATHLGARLGHQEFATRFAARFGGFVLYGDAEPPGLWTVILADGTQLLAALDEDGDRFTLTAATAPIPDLSGVAVDKALGT